MSNKARVSEFLGKAGVYYLATVDGNKPKCRPIGFQMLVDDEIYFCVGDFKEVYKQMQANPYVEICATIETDFIRYFGKAVNKTEVSILLFRHRIQPLFFCEN